MAQRIFTIAGRNGTVVYTDSRKNENGNCPYYTAKGEDTQLESIKVLNKILNAIPEDIVLESPINFLLPNFISFLNYKDNREYWLKNKKTKSGKEISPEILEQVYIMDELVNKLGSKIRLFGQKSIKSSLFQSYIRNTWLLMDKIEKPAEKVDPNSLELA